MATSISIEKSKPSKLRRLPFLPRLGFTVDFAGVELSYRQAPILEALFNMKDRGISVEKLLEVSTEQLREIWIKPDAAEIEVASGSAEKLAKIKK